MGSGWHEWPLMIFTVFGQCVAGGFIVLALALLKGISMLNSSSVVLSMFGLWVLMGIGFIASTLHLGSPMRAFNSLNRVGASSLSNEIASGAIFFAVGGLGWLLAAMKKLPAGLRSLWLIVTMVLGVVFVWMMVRVYNTIDTVPTWYSVWTPMSFFLTMFIGGPLLGYLLLRVAGVDGWAMRLLPAVSLLALVVSAMVALMQGLNWQPFTALFSRPLPWCRTTVADGLAYRSAGRRAGILDCPSAQRLSAGAAAAVTGLCAGTGG
jgi:anaerobic dimethyl sulfoxide reductase subunit C (anchor subunit)